MALKAKLDGLWADAHRQYQHKQRNELEQKYCQMRDVQIAKGRDENKTTDKYLGLWKKACEKIEPFNYSSPAQMAWLLKDYLGLDITNMEGEESTGKAVLNKLAKGNIFDKYHFIVIFPFNRLKQIFG